MLRLHPVRWLATFALTLTYEVRSAAQRGNQLHGMNPR